MSFLSVEAVNWSAQEKQPATGSKVSNIAERQKATTLTSTKNDLKILEIFRFLYNSFPGKFFYEM
jgi:hypothetical protein